MARGEQALPSRFLGASLAEEGFMLVHVVLVLIVAGVALWLIESFIPMDAKVLRLLQAVVVIALVVWLLRVFGIINLLPGSHV